MHDNDATPKVAADKRKVARKAVRQLRDAEPGDRVVVNGRDLWVRFFLGAGRGSAFVSERRDGALGTVVEMDGGAPCRVVTT